MTSGSAFLVTIDGRTTTAVEGTSLFECAEALDVRVPTSCVKQGKCRECLVEVDEGAELLSDPAPQEAHLEGRFRLSCRARLSGSGGSVRFHTLRRGALRIETETRGLVRGGVLDLHQLVDDGLPIEVRGESGEL